VTRGPSHSTRGRGRKGGARIGFATQVYITCVRYRTFNSTGSRALRPDLGEGKKGFGVSGLGFKVSGYM
jgi:hypothetical protein